MPRHEPEYVFVGELRESVERVGEQLAREVDPLRVDRAQVGPDLHEGEPPSDRKVHPRDGTVRGVAGPQHVQIGRKREILRMPGDHVGEPDRTRLSAHLEQHQGLPEHPGEIGTVDLVDKEEVFAGLGGLVGAEQVAGAYIKREAVAGGRGNRPPQSPRRFVPGGTGCG